MKTLGGELAERVARARIPNDESWVPFDSGASETLNNQIKE